MDGNNGGKPPFVNFLLIWTFVFVNLFVAAVLVIYFAIGSEPSTLIVAVFAFFGFECGVMGWIKTSGRKAGKGDDGNEGGDKGGE